MRLRALATALLVAAPLVVTGLQAPANAAGIVTDQGRYRHLQGQTFEVSGKVPPRGRPVILQLRVAKHWKAVDRKRTGAKGRYSFTTGRKLEGCTYADYRVVAPAHGAQKRRVQAFEKAVIKPSATIIVPAVVRPGDPISIDGYVVPGNKLRPVLLQRQRGDGTWATVATERTTMFGALTFEGVRLSNQGAAFRIVAKAWRGLPRTASRAASVVPHDAVAAPAASFEQVSAATPGASWITRTFVDDSGRFVAYEAAPARLGSDDGTDLYVVDRTTGTTAHLAAAPGHFVRLTSISGDGRSIAFDSNDPTLVPGDTNAGAGVFVYDRTTGEVSNVSSAYGGRFLGTDGRFLQLGSAYTMTGIFVRDRQTGTTSPVRIGRPVPGITEDARRTLDAPVVNDPCDVNGETDAQVLDLATGSVRRASPSPDYGGQRNEDSVLRATGAAMSAGGRFVAYDFTGGDNRSDSYLTDLRTGVIRRVYGGGSLDISADGSRVVVSSGAGSTAKLVVVDWRTGQSRTLAGALPGEQDVYGTPSLSADGKDVFFTTTRSDLVAGDTDDQPDVYVAHLG